MPRGFSEQEQKIIREKLLQAGAYHLENYGVRKTTVDELAQAASISKGAFYKFYSSKEELFLDVLEMFEKQFREDSIRGLQDIQAGSDKESIYLFLKKAFSVFKSHPMFHNFNQQDYEILMRRLPAEKVNAHFSSDDDFVADLIMAWAKKGILLVQDVEIVSALAKSLFYVTLHAEEIGEHHPAAFDILLNLVAGYLTKKD